MSIIADQVTLNNVDEFIEEVERTAPSVDTDSVVWERKNLGKSITHRLSKIGRDSFDYQSQFIPPGEESKKLDKNDKQLVMDYYFGQIGRNMLEMQAAEEVEAQEVEKMRHKAATAVKRLARRKIKVADMDHDNEDSLKIDQEWDTSSWSDEDITAGMDYLLFVFVDPKVRDSKYLKDKAMTMIDKLLVRHYAAEKHLSFKLEAIVSRAISRFVKDGRSLAQQDLLCILHVSKEKFRKELSSFNFAGRVMEMLNVEGRLASILIQHRFRTFRGLRRRKKRDVNPITLTFGSDFVMNSLRESSVSARTVDLVNLWKNMHTHQSEEERNTPQGFRGPSHIGSNFLVIILDIVLSLVGQDANDVAQGNREDVCACNGAILLTNFISYPKGPFSQLSLKITSEVCKVAESVQPFLEAGVVNSALKYMLYLRDTDKLQWLMDGKDNLPNRQDMSTEAFNKSQIPKKEFFECILIISRLATHAAGVFRARDGGYYVTSPKKVDVEFIDYAEKSAHLTSSYTGDLVRLTLGGKKFMKELTNFILSCKHLHCMRTMMQCMYNISCGDGHGNILFEFTADAARLLRLVLHFIEEEDLTINTLALCMILQLSKNMDGRETMICSGLPQLLFPFTKARKSFTKPSYLRAMLIQAAILRQHDWRSHNPETAPYNLSNLEFIRISIYKDLLKTLKKPTLEESDGITIADLTLRPVLAECNKDFSAAAEVTGARDITDFLTHPGDSQFIEHLAWEEAVAGCVLLEGLTAHSGTAENLFSNHAVYYLVRSLFISRWMFAGPKQSDHMLMMTFNSVRSAANALTNMCLAVKGNRTYEREIIDAASRADIMDPACYFVNNLAVPQDHLSKGLLYLQRDAAKSILDFMREYSRVMTENAPPTENGDRDLDTIRNLEPIGAACISVIKCLKKVYVHEQDLMVVLLEKCCAVIEVISISSNGAKIVSGEWHSGKALKEHLPPPLSGVGENGIFEENYKIGLQKMSPNLFRCLSNLCQTESGRGDCLSDGFLRRASDKFYLLYPVAEGMLGAWRKDVKEYVKPIDIFTSASPPQQSDDLQYKVRELTSCLVLIGKCANYTSYMFGSANDLLLLDHYDILERCAVIVRRVGETDWCEYMEAALTVLRMLSEDNVRLIKMYEKLDIVGIMRKVLDNIGKVPESAIKLAVDCLKVVAASLRTGYLGLALPTLREPLGRVTRYHPSLLDVVRSASWSVMKLIIDMEKVKKIGPDGPGHLDESEWDKLEFGTSSDSILNRKLLAILEEAGIPTTEASDLLLTKKEQEQKLFEERKARGQLLPHELQHAAQSPLKTMTDMLIQHGAKSYKLEEDSVENVRIVSELDREGTLDATDVMEAPEGDVHGTPFTCGPSHCGSLTLSDPSLQAHGTFRSTVATKRDEDVRAAVDDDTASVTDSVYGTLPAIVVSPIRKKKGQQSAQPSSPGKSKRRLAQQQQQKATNTETEGKKKPGSGSREGEKPSSAVASHALDPTARHRNRRATTNAMKRSSSSKLPTIVDIAEAPEFLETRPPVDENQAYFC